MSDYLFLLESHLTAAQNKVLSTVSALAAESHLNLFFTGGAMRDVLGGHPIRNLHFTIEADQRNAVKAFAERTGALVLRKDDVRGVIELEFPGHVRADVALSRTERYAKPGSKPQVEPAPIHEYLQGRDFTVNAIALSLSNASRGLLLDPANGLADLHNKELRTTSSHSLYDDPVRLLRLVRLKTRLQFQVAERAANQYAGAIEAGLPGKISAVALENELRCIADEALPGDVLKALQEEGLLSLFSPALAGAKLNFPAWQRFQKTRQLIPFGVEFSFNAYAILLFLIFEKLSPRERSAMVKALNLAQPDIEAAAKLSARAKKLEKEISAAKLQRPSALHAVLSKAPGELIVFLLMRSTQRLVIDRLKNYLQKYLPAALEITDQTVIEKGATPGTPAFVKLRQELIKARLDARPKKIVPPEPVPEPPPGARRMSSFGR